MNEQADSIKISFINLWDRMIGFIPQLLAAIIVLILGLIIANALAKLIKKAVYWLKLDDLFNRVGINQKIKSFGWDFTIADILAWFVKWFVIFVTLISAADILRLPQISQFFDSVVAYIPRLFVAVVILTLGFIIGEFVGNAVKKAGQTNRITGDSANLIALISEWAIIIFSFMAAFIQLGIAVSLLNILFTGIVFMLSLAGGLAFGLGGRESAAKILDDLTRRINPKR